jgi:hypothetical protein
MQQTFEIGDVLAAVKAWEKQRLDFLENLKRAKQPEPSADSMDNFKEVFIESWLMGRASK